MYQWDSGNIAHLAKHDVTPDEAEQVISNHPLDLNRQIRTNEKRLVQLGETDSRRVLVVITTMRESLIRVVTAYPAGKRLRTFYKTQKGPTHERTPKET